MNATVTYVCLIPIFFIPVLNTVKFKGFVVELRELKYMFIFFVTFYLLVFLKIIIKCELYTNET